MLIKWLTNAAAGNDEIDVSIKTIIKGTSIVMLPGFMLLTGLYFYGEVGRTTALLSMLFILIMSIIFVTPYVSNLSALIHYVKQLSRDKDVKAPDLSFLNNVEELSESVAQLHDRWQVRQKRLEGIVEEGKLLLNILPDALIMLDKDLEMIGTNDHANEEFGGQFFNETINKIVNDEIIRDAALRTLRKGIGQDVEYFLPKPFQKNYLVRIENFPGKSNGKIALIMVMHDVTKQKQTEQMLADFVANASHEMRTPLTTLSGFIETLRNMSEDELKHRGEFLSIMDTQASRMSNLIQDLLSLSQIERNQHTKPTDSVSVKLVLDQVVESLKTRADEKNMVLATNLQDDALMTLGDQGQLTQVFENIIGNSIKYAHSKSTITVNSYIVSNTFEEELHMQHIANLILVSVSDKSDGIPPEHIDRLTERFYRVDGARSRKVGGTGLGLSIVKHILERHTGALKITSKLGKGSVFTILLPSIENSDN